MRKKILISGGLGKFAKQLLIQGSENFNISAPSRQSMDVRNPRQIYSEIVNGEFDNIVQDSFRKNKYDCIIIFWDIINPDVPTYHFLFTIY